MGVALDDVLPTGGFNAPKLECAVAVAEPEGTVGVVEPESAGVVIDLPTITDAMLVAGVVEAEPAVTPPGAAIPAEPSGPYVGKSSPVSSTLAQPDSSGQAPPLSIVLMVTPVVLHPVTVE